MYRGEQPSIKTYTRIKAAADKRIPEQVWTFFMPY